jgi:K+-sensing histidine kinase KdpD
MQLHRISGDLRSVITLLTALHRAKNPEELYRRALDLVRGTLAADRAMLLLMPLRNRAYIAKVYEGFSEDYARAVEAALTDKPLDRTSLHVISPAESADRADLVKAGRTEGIESAVFVPLGVDDANLGWMVASGMPEGEETLKLAGTVAHAIAATVSMAGVPVGAATPAEEELRQAHQQVRLLLAASGSLASSLQLSDVMRSIRELAEEMIQADAYAIWRYTPAADKWSIALASGLSEEYKATMVEAGPQMPDEPFIVEDVEAITDPRLSQRLQSYKQEGIRSLLVMPMRIRGENLGTLVFYYRAPHKFEERELLVAESLANLGATAISMAELYEEQARVRELAQMSERSKTFLAEASAALSSSLEYEVTLKQLAEVCVPELADWCAIDLLEDGELRRVAVYDPDPSKIKTAEELRSAYGPQMDDPKGPAAVTRTGEPELYPEVPADKLADFARDERHLELLQSLETRSVLIVPLEARGRPLGALTLIARDRCYAAEDLALAQEVGRRAGIAVENSLLYRRAHETETELRKVNEAKDEFLGLLSHELKGPITTIHGGAGLLRGMGAALAPDAREDLLSDIESESERLARLLDDMLVLARMELGQQVETEPVLLSRIVEKEIEAFSRRWPARKVEFQPAKDLPIVKAVPRYVEQVMRNLLSNAHKYSPPDTPIEVRLERESDFYLQAGVRDYGSGVPEDEIDRVFDRFYRSSQTSGRARGTGIGLTVCRRLVEAQSGRIWAETAEGGGLCICFTLPALDQRAGT